MVKKCESCGMPMEEASQHGGGDINNLYCVHCTTPTGKLKSRSEVREGMIQFYMDAMKKSREEAEKVVDEVMSKAPAWR
jgi:hypothetical protein